MKKIGIPVLLAVMLLLSTAAIAQAAPKRPTVLVSKFTTSPSPVIPGQDFALNIELENVGDKDARNISIVIDNGLSEGKESPAEPVFSPVESGNVLFMDKITSAKSRTAAIRMITGGDTKPGVYNLNLTVKYGDSGSASYQLSQSIGVVVTQQETLKIVSFKAPDQMKPGESGELSAEIVNLGNASIRGIKLDLKGDIKGEEQSQYFGTFEPGDNDEFSTKFKLDKEGVYQGQVLVSYYDSFNQLKEARQDFSIQVKAEELASEKKQEKKGGFLEGIKDFFSMLLGLGGKE